MPEGVELTIRLRQEGFEQAQAEMQQLKTSMATVKTEASILDKVTKLSLTNFVIAANLVVNIGLAGLEVFGVAIENATKALVQTLLNYVTQLAMIATAQMSVGNVAAAITITTLATTIQVKGIVEMERMERDAKTQIAAGKRSLANLSQLILTVNR